MHTQPCLLWLNSRPTLTPIKPSDSWIVQSTDRMMAMSVPIWKTLLGCPADPLALSHPQASHNQLERRRGEGPEERQHLIGELQWVQFFIFPDSGGHRTAAHFLLLEQWVKLPMCVCFELFLCTFELNYKMSCCRFFVADLYLWSVSIDVLYFTNIILKIELFFSCFRFKPSVMNLVY